MISYLKIILIIIHTLIFSILALTSALIDRSFKSYFVLTRIWPRGVLLISGVKLITKGTENLDKNAIYVFASNHSSQFDIPAMQIAIPNRSSIVFKKELAKIPLFGWQLKYGPYIIVDRQKPAESIKSIEVSKQRMKKKNFSITIFPEGTRSIDGSIQPFKRGAFHLAAQVGFPIVPVTINGTDKLLPKGKFRMKPGTIEVVFDKPIDTSFIKNKNDEIKLMEDVRNIILKNKKD